MTVFRPSCRVRLTLRTEEFENTSTLDSNLPVPGPAAPVPPQVTDQGRPIDGAEALRQNEIQQRDLNMRRDALPPEEFERQRAELLQERSQIQSTAAATAATNTEALRPTSVAGTAPDDLTVIGDIEPLSVQLERNGLVAADTCTITMDYLDAPFDPRVIRAAHVEVLLGVVSADNFEAGAERDERRADGSLLSSIGKDPDGSIVGGTRFVGFVDDWAVKYSDQGDTVTLECRDMSAPLRDLKINPGESIDLGVPLDEGVQAFLDAVSPTTSGVVVRFAGEGQAPVPADAAPARRFPRRGATRRRARRGDQEMTLWDHITDVCRAVGFIPTVRDFEIVIAEARTLFSTEAVRRMVYGQNIQELNFTRRLQGQKVPTIEVRAYDAELGRTRWARFPVRSGDLASGILGREDPPAPLRANEITPSGANPTEVIRVLEVSGVSDPAVLERVAQNAFEQLGRQEIEGTLATYDVSSYEQPPDDADLLLAVGGDPVEILIVAGVPQGFEDEGPNTSLAQLQAFSRSRREQYLISIGWDASVAQRFSALQEATAYQTVFRVQDVRVSWDHEEGIRIDIGFINYITAREDAAAA